MAVLADPASQIDGALRKKRPVAKRSVAKRPNSAARLTANRHNALKSTGPRTVEGKRRSSRNAFKHGMRSRIARRQLQTALSAAVLPGECDAEFQKVKHGFRDEFRPRGAAEELLIDQIATQVFRLRRLAQIERGMIEVEMRRVAGSRVATSLDVLAPSFARSAHNL